MKPNDLDIQLAGPIARPASPVPEPHEKPSDGRNLPDGPLRFANTFKTSYKDDSRHFRLWIIGLDIAAIVVIGVNVGLGIGLQHQPSKSAALFALRRIAHH